MSAEGREYPMGVQWLRSLPPEAQVMGFPRCTVSDRFWMTANESTTPISSLYVLKSRCMLLLGKACRPNAQITVV